jgi:hypothetical protein
MGIDKKATKIIWISVRRTVPMKRDRKRRSSGCVVGSGGLIDAPGVERCA